MNNNALHRGLIVAGVVLAATLLLGSGALPLSHASLSSKNLAARDNQRLARHGELKTRLASTRRLEFQTSLAALSRLDEIGSLDLWRVALNNSIPELRSEAWLRYREVQAQLSRKQFVPQIARIAAPQDQVVREAQLTGLEVTVWSAGDNQTVAAVPPYLIERLRDSGIDIDVIYDSVAEWQKARANSEDTARSISPPYQVDGAGSLIRIAVTDLDERGAPAPGYSDWFGDPENILMRDGSLLAYLDIFQSDGSAASVDAHISERYARRGYKLKGFYTPEEFADRAPELFAGKSFEAGRRTRKTPRSGEVGLALTDGKFHSYDETITEFKALATAHPELARYSKLGTSFEGREIFALKISKDASVDDESKPDVLITGLHHAREWISVESPVYFANQLLSRYSTDDTVKYLVDHLQIWIVPIVNPDGLNFTQDSQNEFDAVRLWRKNRRPISGGSCPSSVGVDINRNYSFQWRLQNDEPCSDYCSNRGCVNDDIGASDDPSAEIYRGPQAESEAEVKAIKSLVDDPHRHFRAQLDYHNYAQLILYPWGYAPFGTNDEHTLTRLAQQMSDALFTVDRKRYRPRQAVDLYSLTGSSIDYAYGVNRVPAPFVVEMRPDCCDFTVPESQIPLVNQENWAGAQALLHWAAGPPILESVKAYSTGPDGTLSKVVYSARWTSSSDGSGRRQMIVDTRFPGIDPGRLQVRLQFSRPMNPGVPPLATLGRDSRLNEVTLGAIFENEGWQKTVYANDTWVGETVLIDDGNVTSSWQLGVSTTDPFGLKLDGAPNTIASYTAGMSHWANYEDANGNGNEGGIDTRHSLGPGLRGDFPSILVASPGADERLAGGDDYEITWTAPNAPGFPQELSLSTDGGSSFAPLAENIPSDAQRFRVKMPRVATTRGRILLLATEPISRNFLIAVSQSDFTIGLNVGSNVDVSFVSSEKVDVNWSDTQSSDSSTASGPSRLIINLKVTNRGNTPIANPFLRVAEMNRHVLLTRDPKSNWTDGARFYVDAGSDHALSPGESVDARLVVGLFKQKKFFMSVEIYGVPGEPVIPANAVTVWTGKPRVR